MEEKKIILPHHEQLNLCTTRLPYRQGRKLTAIKVYTINNESKHLLIFGVPALNLLQEIKSLLKKFGKILQIRLSHDYPTEIFTETYHIVFEKIQSARFAKKKLDANNFYGGVLHICYAPELETINEVRDKILLRRQEVMHRLKRNNWNSLIEEKTILKQKEEQDLVEIESKSSNCLINMGEINVIKNITKNVYTKVKKRSMKEQNTNTASKIIKPCYIENKYKPNFLNQLSSHISNYLTSESLEDVNIENPVNHNQFGNEVIKKYNKPINRIVFTLNK